MNACTLAFFGNDCGNAFFYDILRIRLARIDDVINRFAAAEFRTRLLVLRFKCRRDPNFLTVFVNMEELVKEIHAQNSKLPHLIGDVLAGVSHGSVRTHQDLIGFVFVVAGMRFKRHYPATGVLAFGFQTQNAERFHLLKSLLPEMEMKNFRFARQQIVADRKALHRRKNALHISCGNIIGKFCRIVIAFFYEVQHFGTFFFQFLIGLIFNTDFCVKVPTIIVKSLAFSGEF